MSHDVRQCRETCAAGPAVKQVLCIIANKGWRQIMPSVTCCPVLQYLNLM